MYRAARVRKSFGGKRCVDENSGPKTWKFMSPKFERKEPEFGDFSNMNLGISGAWSFGSFVPRPGQQEGLSVQAAPLRTDGMLPRMATEFEDRFLVPLFSVILPMSLALFVAISRASTHFLIALSLLVWCLCIASLCGLS